jgi:signal transduction histidine kinase
MKRWLKESRPYVVPALFSFLIALIGVLGLVLRGDLPGRIIFGTAWTVVVVAWSSRYYYARLRVREREVLDLRENLLAQARDTAAQQERNRLARELHDSIKQQVFSIHMSAAAVEARWEADPGGAREALGDVRRSAREAMAEMNALLQQLSPAPLEKVGLVQALRDQCEALGYRSGAEVVVEFGELPADDWLPAGAQDSLFRVAQEALSNVARHARAAHVRLYLGQPGGAGPLIMEIGDDGQGFEMEMVRGGMGLQNIRQRVQALEGKFGLDSAPGGGTTLRVTIPLAEPVFSDEDAILAPNHMLNKALLAGLGGGLVLIATLFYPLYVLLPGRYVAGWPAGSEVLGLMLEIAAPLIVAAFGFLAARWTRAGTRQTGALLGALAGGVTGLFLYFGIGAPTSAVAGGAGLLVRGLLPAADKAEATRLLAEAVIGIVWWSHGTFWATLLGGAGLGAIGGFVAPPAPESSDRPDLRPAGALILVAAGFFSAFISVIAVVIFSVLESAIRDGIAEYAISLGTDLAVEGVSLWLIGTPMAFYLASLVALYFLLRVEARENDPVRLNAAQATAVVFGLLSMCLSVYLLIMCPRAIRPLSMLGVAVIAIIAGSLVLGGLYLALFIQVLRRRGGLSLGSPHIARYAALFIALLSLGLVGWAINLPPFLTVLVGLVVIGVDVLLIFFLRRHPGPPLSGASPLARRRWTMSQMNGGLGAAVAMIVPAMTTVSVGVALAKIAIWLVPVLVGSGASGQVDVESFTLVELVRDVYLTQARAFLISLVGALASVGLPMLIISGIMAATGRHSTRSAERLE